jgi:outer membrane protein
MRLRPFIVFLTFLLTLPLLAQSELGIFASHATFSKDSASDPTLGLTEADIKFDSKAGYGISFNHFFSPDMSIQLSGQTLRADAKVQVSVAGVTASEAGGTLDVKQYAAIVQYYVNPRGTVVPYVGVGLAWMRSGKLSVAADSPDGITASTIHMKDKKTWVVDAGVDLRLLRSVAVTLAGTYTRYTAKLETSADDPDNLFQNLRLDPVTVSAGLRMRF